MSRDKRLSILPNALTISNLGMGILALIIMDPVRSAICILIGAICDVFDGYAARKLNVEGEMGKELDSLADLVTFGIAPVFVYIQYNFQDNIFGTAVVIFVGMNAAYRLAKFNTLPSSDSFIGLPTPAFGSLVVGFLLGNYFQPDIFVFQPIFIFSNGMEVNISFLLICCAALIMNSKFPFFSLKNMTRYKLTTLYAILVIITFLLGLIFFQEQSLWVTMCAYILTGIVGKIIP